MRASRCRRDNADRRLDSSIRRVDEAGVGFTRCNPSEYLAHIGAVDSLGPDAIEEAELRQDLLTIKTAVVATVVTFFLGIGLALAVARMRRFQGLADAVITLPLVLPPTVVGFFLLLAFGRRSAIGKFLLQFDVTIVFTWKAAVIAAIVVSLPLMYRTARGAFEQLDPNIVGAARTLGVSEWRIFWHVLVPNARSGILAGLVLSFTRALGEFGATIMFAGNIPGVTQTMSTAVYAAVQANDYGLAFDWAIVIVVFSLVFVTLMNNLIARTGAPRRREV